MTKIDIISGFLGAGKTTLIKKLLEEAYKGEQVVLIENEFGEIGIDGGFLKDAGVNITEMNSGCICCSLVGDFGKALTKVINEYHPDRIIIEPSGVGKLSDVIRAVQRASETTPMELNCFIAVADATKCKMYMKNFGEFFNNQIEHANTIILSRAQNTIAADDCFLCHNGAIKNRILADSGRVHNDGITHHRAFLDYHIGTNNGIVYLSVNLTPITHNRFVNHSISCNILRAQPFVAGVNLPEFLIQIRHRN